jgi:RNA polymerase sigma factor (sigma-70 family)
VSIVRGARVASSAGRIIRSVSAPADEATDEALMLAYAAGDRAAFAALYARHERPVYRFLLRSLGGDAAVADDLLQDVWLAVVRNATGYAPRARFTTWLYGIARTKLIDHWRAHARPEVRSLDEPAANDPDGSGVESLAAARSAQPEVQALSRAHARAFVDAVERLPPAQREAFLLHAEGDLTLEEIAQATGAGVETAKSRLRYAMNRLRAALEDWQ